MHGNGVLENRRDATRVLENRRDATRVHSIGAPAGEHRTDRSGPACNPATTDARCKVVGLLVCYQASTAQGSSTRWLCPLCGEWVEEDADAADGDQQTPLCGEWVEEGADAADGDQQTPLCGEWVEEPLAEPMRNRSLLATLLAFRPLHLPYA